MRTESTKTVVVTVRTYKCDYCEKEVSLDNNHSPRRSGMEWCEVCHKDCCRNHTQWFQEFVTSDYADLTVCSGCAPAASEAWKRAVDSAGRHDDLKELVMRELRPPTAGEKP